MPDREVAVEVTVPVPSADVWRALRDPAEIRRWHGWDFDGLDEEIDVIYLRDVESAHCGSRARLATADGSRFELEDGVAGTILRVTMPAPAERLGRGLRRRPRGARVSFVWQLRFVLEHHLGRGPRTVFNPTAPSEPAAGRELFRTPHQVGRVVDEYGPGLVIEHMKPAGGMVIVTTYGLDDDAFAQVERRWG